MSFHSNITPVYWAWCRSISQMHWHPYILLTRTKKTLPIVVERCAKAAFNELDHKVNHNNLCVQIRFKVNAMKWRIEERSCHKYTIHACMQFVFFLYSIWFCFVLFCSFLFCSVPSGYPIIANNCDHSNWFVLICLNATYFAQAFVFCWGFPVNWITSIGFSCVWMWM